MANATVPFLAASLDDYPLPVEAAENPPIYLKFLVGISVVSSRLRLTNG
jgi:hypothetical protein